MADSSAEGRSSGLAGGYRINETVDHTCAAIDESLYLWPGNHLPAVHNSAEKEKLTSHINIFTLSSGKWTTHETKGSPPLGVMGYFCIALTNTLYYFGGWCGHGLCYHNSLNQLNVSSLVWTELEPTFNERPVMRRGWGGMISIECDGTHQLLIIGGVGSQPTTQLPQADYVKLPTGRCRTNELSLYNLSTGDWSNPSITGYIPPISIFITEKMKSNQAIVFGGLINEGSASDSVYLMELSENNVCWQSVKKHDQIDRWPMERYYHAATIVTGLVSPVVVTVGGLDQDTQVLNECWVFDITYNSWTKVTLPHSVSERWAHSLSAFTVGPNCVWLVVVGGRNKNHGFICTPDIVVVIELFYNELQWSVGDVLDSTALSAGVYQRKYLQQLKSGRRKWLEQHQKSREREEVLINELQQLHEQKEREKQDVDQQLEDKERELKEKKKELFQFQETVVVKQEQIDSQAKHHNMELQKRDSYIAQLTRRINTKEKELVDGAQPLELNTTVKSIQSQDTSQCSEIHRLSIGDVNKLTLVLQSVDSDWYQLGQFLDVEESLLNDIKQEGHSSDELLKQILEIWLEKERTVAQLENALKSIGKDDLLPDLHQLLSPVLYVTDFHDSSQFQADRCIHATKTVECFGGCYFWLVSLILIPILMLIFGVFFSVQDDGIMFINKTVIGGKADSIVWPDNSFKMEIPYGVFSYGHHVDISVSLDNSHQLENPQNYKSLSQTYKLTASEKLQEPIILTLKHNGLITSNEEALSIAVLHQSDDGAVELLQGTTAINSSYVVFQLTQLCWIRIIGTVAIPMRYWLTFHRRQVSRSNSQGWKICLLLSPIYIGNKKLTNWIPDDTHEDILYVTKTYFRELEIKPIGCWVNSKYTDNVQVDVNDVAADIKREFHIEWRLNCTDSFSSIRLYDSKTQACVYEIFDNPDIPGCAMNCYLIITAVVLSLMGITVFICILRKTSCLRRRKALHIKDLVSITAVLSKGYFPNNKWSDLGLQLGIYKPKLDDIEEKHRGDPSKCLIECLSTWLRREDNVDNKGGPHWSSLKRALEEIGESACARTIKL